ncbi:MAG: Nramp family divalent metal transporter [Acidobacteria bacterium]|nr:Nramp family divalent metal transporter [Acidobacteriota bacterium]
MAGAPTHAETAVEARSGLDPWTRADLPVPPSPRGTGWLKAVGPGVIVLGLSIGSGEFLLGPAVFVRHGLALLWVAGVAVYFQTIFNTELMRYTLATGEPVFTGFMRTRPSSTFWAWVYSVLYFLQVGWPGWAGAAAGAIFFLFARQLPAAADGSTIYLIGVGTFLACAAILTFGNRIERTLELLNWVMVTAILSSFLILAVLFVPAGTWASAAVGLAGFDLASARFDFFPADADLFLLAAVAAYAGAGGVTNIVLANWARDRGYGMSERAGYIPCAVGGQKVHLAHNGFIFEDSPEARQRWRGWWRIVRADQWGVFFAGALAGMILPAMLYVTFIPRGSDIQGLGIAAALAQAVSGAGGALLGGVIAFLAAWVLFKTQLDQLEGMVRAITDMLWTGSSRLRGWRGGDVRVVYYGVLACVVLWGTIALRLAQPFFLIQVGANMAGLVLVIGAIHLLYLNTQLLPSHVRPPMWRRVMLVAMAIFYGFFVVRSFATLVGA